MYDLGGINSFYNVLKNYACFSQAQLTEINVKLMMKYGYTVIIDRTTGPKTYKMRSSLIVIIGDVHLDRIPEELRARKKAITTPSTKEPNIKMVSSSKFRMKGSPSSVL